jgi:hypothetical protein
MVAASALNAGCGRHAKLPPGFVTRGEVTCHENSDLRHPRVSGGFDIRGLVGLTEADATARAAAYGCGIYTLYRDGRQRSSMLTVLDSFPAAVDDGRVVGVRIKPVRCGRSAYAALDC